MPCVPSLGSRLPSVPPRLAEAMRRRLEPEDQAVFGRLLAGIEKAEVAATLGMSHAVLDSRMWTMRHKLEGLVQIPSDRDCSARLRRRGDGDQPCRVVH